MEHSIDFFKDEVRNGFYIPTAIKQAWAAELDVLSEIDRVCLANGIKYFADWGTILGAVRHGGFVPWDDDLDICMLRDDYQKFRKAADKELPANFAIHDYERKENHWLFLSRVVNNSKMCFDLEYLDKHNNFPWLAGVDIFVKDYLFSEDDLERERDKEIMHILAVADGIIDGRADEKIASIHLNELKKKYHSSFPDVHDKRAVGVALYRLAEKQMAKVKPDETDRVGQIFPFVLKNGTGSAEKKELYEATIRLPFEDTTIPVPAAYNAVLTSRYGNYNQIHKVWGGHNYPFFEGQKAEMESLSGEKFPGFAFRPEMLVRPEVSGQSSLKSISLECLEKMKALLSDAEHTLQAGAFDEFNRLMSDSQQLAADYGSLVEEVKGEDRPCAKKVVAALQQYCDDMWDEYQAVNSGGKQSSLEKSYTALALVEAAVKKQILGRKEVLFLPLGADEWSAFEKYYKTSLDEAADVFIVPMPVMKKTFMGDILMSDDEIESTIHLERYPKDLVCTHWKTYDISKHCPDIVYIQNPYDGANPCLTVPPAFYAKNLRRFSQRIIYIPIRRTAEFGEEDKTDLYNLKHYAAAPGVVFADEVYVQSSNIKKQYIKALTEFAQDTEKEVWEKKILVDESIDSKEPSGQKKKLIYCIGANELSEHPQIFRDSMAKRLDILSGSSERLDVSIALYPDNRNEWMSVDPELSREIFALVEKAVSERNMHLIAIDQKKADLLVSGYDAYYGSPSPLVPAFAASRKPVMLADYGI